MAIKPPSYRQLCILWKLAGASCLSDCRPSDPCGWDLSASSKGAGERRAGSRADGHSRISWYMFPWAKRLKIGRINKYKQARSSYTERKKNYLLRFLRGKWELAAKKRQTRILMGSFAYLRTQNFKTASQNVSITVLVKFQYIDKVRKASMNLNSEVMHIF